MAGLLAFLTVCGLFLEGRIQAEVKVWAEVWSLNQPKEDLWPSIFRVYVFADNRGEPRATRRIELRFSAPEGTKPQANGVLYPRPYYPTNLFVIPDFFEGKDFEVNTIQLATSIDPAISAREVKGQGVATNTGIIFVYTLYAGSDQIGRQSFARPENVKAFDQDGNQ